MAGEAEVLPNAVDRHVDAAGAFEAANVHGHTGVLRIVGRRRSGNAAQQIIGSLTRLKVDLVRGDRAGRTRLVVGIVVPPAGSPSR